MSVKTKNDLYIPFSWEERRHVFLDRFFYIPKKYDSAQSGELIDWMSPLVFGNDKPVYMEICSGNGQWVVEQAKAHPDVNWVAVEIRFERARQIWQRGCVEGLPNLYVVCGEALEFLRYYVHPKSVTQCFVNFPDPWPKRQHAKHRIVQSPFVSVLKTVLKENGTVTLATDSEPYREQMLCEFAAWPSDFPGPFFVTELASYGESFFADLWMKRGRELYYLRYQNALD